MRALRHTNGLELCDSPPKSKNPRFTDRAAAELSLVRYRPHSRDINNA
jgi:hypothetical protein